MATINWYPGHMAKSRRMLIEQLRAVDAVVELVDARAPLSSANPDLRGLTRGKARLLVLNKADLADDAATSRWLEYFREKNVMAMRFNSNGGRVKEMLERIARATQPAVERAAARGVKKTVRLMVVGIPNVGKSTFINRLNGSAVAKASDRPGVTRAKQWGETGAVSGDARHPRHAAAAPGRPEARAEPGVSGLGARPDPRHAGIGGSAFAPPAGAQAGLGPRALQIGGNGAERRRRSAAACRPVASRRGASGGRLQRARLAFVRRGALTWSAARRWCWTSSAPARWARSRWKARRCDMRESAEAKLLRLTQIEENAVGAGPARCRHRRGGPRAAGRAGGDGLRLHPQRQAGAGRGRFQEALGKAPRGPLSAAFAGGGLRAHGVCAARSHRRGEHIKRHEDGHGGVRGGL